MTIWQLCYYHHQVDRRVRRAGRDDADLRAGHGRRAARNRHAGEVHHRDRGRAHHHPDPRGPRVHALQEHRPPRPDALRRALHPPWEVFNSPVSHLYSHFSVAICRNCWTNRKMYNFTLNCISIFNRGDQISFLIGNDSPPHLNPNLQIKMPKRKSKMGLMNTLQAAPRSRSLISHSRAELSATWNWITVSPSSWRQRWWTARGRASGPTCGQWAPWLTSSSRVCLRSGDRYD